MQADTCSSPDLQPAISLTAAAAPESYISSCTILGPCSRGIHISTLSPVLLSQNTIWGVHGHGIALLPPSPAAAGLLPQQIGGLSSHEIVENLVGGSIATGLGLPSEAEPAAVAIDVPGCNVRCIIAQGRWLTVVGQGMQCLLSDGLWCTRAHIPPCQIWRSVCSVHADRRADMPGQLLQHCEQHMLCQVGMALPA